MVIPDWVEMCSSMPGAYCLVSISAPISLIITASTPDLLQIGYKLGIPLDFVVALQGIGGDVHLHPFSVGQLHPLGQLLRVKVGHAAPHSKFLPRQIHRIGAVLQGCLQPPQVPGGASTSGRV